jgi:uncharacterized protein (TIGR00369 family)
MTDPMTSAPNDRFELDVRQSFERQSVMTLLGARLARVAPGAVDVTLAFREDLTQQGGALHAGVVTSIADSACGYAAMTLMPAGSEVLSVEFKVNLLRPARGERFVAEGRVIKPGRTLTVTRADVYALAGESRILVATMLGTMIRRPPANG